MNTISQLVAAIVAVLGAAGVCAQNADEPARLRLALDGQGRLHLSTDPVPQTAPSLYPTPLPLLSAKLCRSGSLINSNDSECLPGER